MRNLRPIICLLLASGLAGCNQDTDTAPDRVVEVKAMETGPFTVASTNIEVAAEYAEIGDELMHEYLLGRPDESGSERFLTDILKHPDSTWVIDAAIPDRPELYGPASGLTLPIVTYMVFPSDAGEEYTSYTFPYHNGSYGSFENMLEPDDTPILAASDKPFPLVVLSHGSGAHGLYETGRAQRLASHGYIVAVVTYGDDRTAQAGGLNQHLSFLRPLLTKIVIDELLQSDAFGEHIDADSIGISGHSYGGFTTLAIAGGPFLGNTATVNDPRIKAGSIAAPWVGGNYEGNDIFPFGENNDELSRVNIPIISFFGTSDEVTRASFILPAMKKLSGPTYVVELVDQPHVFEGGSWQDRDSWELLFFSAYLKNDSEALEILREARSAGGGNEDFQLFDYQKL